jgi:hypothetical protein
LFYVPQAYVPMGPPVPGLVREREMVSATFSRISRGVEPLIYTYALRSDPNRAMDIAEAEILREIHDLERQSQLQLDDLVDGDRRRGDFADLLPYPTRTNAASLLMASLSSGLGTARSFCPTRGRAYAVGPVERAHSLGGERACGRQVAQQAM